MEERKNVIAYVTTIALIMGILCSAKPMVVSADKNGQITKNHILGTTNVHGKFVNFEYATVSNVAGSYIFTNKEILQYYMLIFIREMKEYINHIL